MSAGSRGVDELVAAARSLGLDAGWDRQDTPGVTPGVTDVRLRAWVDDYEAARVVSLDVPGARPVSVERLAKRTLNSCLQARGVMSSVYDVACCGSTNRRVPAIGSRSSTSYPSKRHLELFEQGRRPFVSYAELGLHACLQGLITTFGVADDVYRRGTGEPIGPTVAARVLQVHDAWVQDEWSFGLTYDYAAHDGRLGFRACVLDRRRPGRFAWMYGDDLPTPPDPVIWGSESATLDIREPLGTMAEHLRYDQHGVGWWGDGPHDSKARLSSSSS